MKNNLAQAIAENNTHLLRELVDRVKIGENISPFDFGFLMTEACNKKDISTDIIKHLLPFYHHTMDQSSALAQAVWQGRRDIVMLLLPKSNPKDRQSQALFLRQHRGLRILFLLSFLFLTPKPTKAALFWRRFWRSTFRLSKRWRA